MTTPKKGNSGNEMCWCGHDYIHHLETEWHECHDCNCTSFRPAHFEPSRKSPEDKIAEIVKEFYVGETVWESPNIFLERCKEIKERTTPNDQHEK